MTGPALFGRLSRVVSALLVCAWTASAHAQDADPALPTVVLVQPQGEPVRAGLEPSLRIQLRGTAQLQVRAPAGAEFPSDVPSRIAAADRIAQQAPADWVVWTDSASAPSDQAVLYVVGQRDGRALIEVVRVPGGQGPEVDRSLALKVYELIGVQDGAAYALGNAEPPPPPSAHVEAPRARAPHVQLWLEAGAQASSEGSAGLAGDALLAIGASVATPALLLTLPLELTFGLPRTTEAGGNSVRWSELGVAAWLRIAARTDRVLLGGGLGGKLGVSDAQGTAASGAKGKATETLPALLISLDAELLLSRELGLRLLLGIEQRLRRQHLLIENVEVADTGRTVLLGRLTAVWHAF